VTRLSIEETYKGRHVLVAGSSGFLGKVWLAMVLERLPDIGKLYLLVRDKGRGAESRFEKMLTESFVFKTLHEALGDKASEFISARVEIIAGDVSSPGLGIDEATTERLHRDVDLVLNIAGLVDFNPDVRAAVSSNIDGGLFVADFVEACDHAKLLHVSTCYVAGMRDGVIEETVSELTPNGRELNAEQEVAHLRQLIIDTAEENESPGVEATLHREIIARIHKRGLEPSEKRIGDMVVRLKRKRLREMMVKCGTDRAIELGWPNTYTYTKALAELLLAEREGLEHAVFRPAIVESASSYPFRGWNEGFNTSGPLVYLAESWLHHVPAQAGNALDIIPVDYVCNALLIVGAAVIQGDHEPVYQCGSSDRNFFPVERLIELSSLGHRQHLKKHGANALERLVMSRWDATPAEPEHALNISNIRAALKQAGRYFRLGRPEKLPSEVLEASDDLAKTADTARRKLRQIEDVLSLFTPFTYDHFLIFRCRAIEKHDVVEPLFRFEPEEIDWRVYWLQAHMPGLRRWSFPQYENGETETYTPEHPFQMIAAEADETPRPRVG